MMTLSGQTLSGPTLSDLLDDLRGVGIRLWVEEGRLCFKAPRGALDDRRRAEIAAHRAELIALLGGAGDRPVPAGGDGGPWPLSLAQRRLWIVEQFDQGPAYTIAGAVRITGPLDAGALARSLDELAARHPALRTGIRLSDGEPEQFLAENGGFPLERLDHSDAPDPWAAGRAELARLASTRFALDRPPLARAVLVRVGPDRHLFGLAQHHAVSDGWTVSLLLRELSALYRARRTGVAAELPAAAVTYGDFARWQRGPERTAALERHVAAQVERLRGAPELLELPTIGPRPAAQSSRGALCRAVLPAAAVEALRGWARDGQATLFMALLSAFAVIVGRYARSEDLVIGTPVAGRQRPELHGVAGLFVNTVPLRLDLSGDPDGVELLQRVKSATLAGLAHQDAPFERIADALEHRRDARYQPVCQVLFALQSALTDRLDLDGAVLELEPLSNGTCKVDLFLAAEERPDGSIGLELEYCTDLFDAGAMARFLTQFQRAAALLAAAERPVASLDLSGEDEKRLLAGWHGPFVSLGADSVPAAFAAIAAARPEAVAVEAAAVETGAEGDAAPVLTYGALDRRSARLARRLAAAGVRPGTVVAVAVPRGLDLPVALLGVLRAGAAYLPVDTARPDPRLSAMLDECGAAAVVMTATTDDPVRAMLPGGLPVISPQEGPGDAEDPDAALALPDADALAYVMFTSGTTGGPKGVEITHRNILRLVAGVILDPDPDGGMLQFASVAFDAATFEIWGALLTGRRLVMAPPEAMDAAEIAAMLDRHRVSTAWFTAGLFHRLVEEIPDALARLRRLYAGGDVLHPGPVRTVLDRMAALGNHGGLVVNGYGPTECTTFTCLHAMPAGGSVPPRIPIGRPIANTRVEVVGPDGRPEPVGVPGELVVGGDGVARGYVGRPDLTAERFLPDPCRPDRSRYRTGDLVRWREDGTLDFLGRIDRQVKLRGFRIEPREIEDALLATGMVGQAAVILVEGDPSGPGVKRLAAYVTPRDGAAADRAALRRALAGRLPDYMVPDAITLLPALPLNRNGKVEHARLPPPAHPPSPDGEDATGDAGIEAVGSERLSAVLTVWREVLGTDRIGPADNFFQLGGDSILAIRTVAALGRRGWQVSIRDILVHQRAAALAAVLQPQGSADGGPAEAAPADGPLPALAPMQADLLGRRLVRPDHWNMPVLLEVRQATRERVAEGLDWLIRRHDGLRQRFRRDDGGQWSARIDAPGPAPLLPVHRLPEEEGEREAGLTAIADALQTTLDLDRGPLLAGAWVERVGAPPLLLLTAHHLVVDVVSWHLLIGELGGFCANPAAVRRLPPAPSWRAWVTALAESAERRETELPVWDEAVDADTAIAGFPAGAVLDEAAAVTVSVTLGVDETRAFLTDVPAAYHTEPTSLLVSAVADGFGAFFGRDSLRIDLERHGREALGGFAGGLVGWLTALVPLRLDRRPGDPDALLLEVKRRLRRVPGDGSGWGILRHLSPDPAVRRRAAAVGRGLVAVNYLGQLDAGYGDGLPLVPVDGPVGKPYASGAERSHPFELVAAVTGGRLAIHLRFSPDHTPDGDARALVQGVAAALRRLVAHAADPAAGGLVPEDVPATGLDDEGLAAVLTAIGPDAHGRCAARRIVALAPLSHQQRGMLMESLMTPGGGLHLEQMAFTLTGRADVAALRDAWRAAAVRHPVLRTAFLWRGLAQPVQAVLDQPPDFAIAVRSEPLPLPDIAAALAADRSVPLDPERPGVFRLSLLTGDDGLTRLVWTFHHLLLDGWSVALVLRDVALAYGALARGREPQLPAPPPPYTDYVAWLGQRGVEEAERFWRDALGGFRPRPVRPADDRTEVGESHGDLLRTLDADLSRRLREAARRHGVALNTLFQGGWATVVAALTGVPDPVFGTTVAGRPLERPDLAGTAGLFIDTLPFRVRLPEGGEPLGAWLARLQLDHEEVRRHGHVPAGLIQHWAGVAALYDTLLVFENYPQDSLAPSVDGEDSLRIVDVAGRGARTRNALVLMVIPDGEGLRLHLVHDRRRCGPVSAAGVLDALETVLATLADPDAASLPALAMPWQPVSMEADLADAEQGTVMDAPVGPVETELAAVCRGLFGRPVGREESFFDMGGHSLLVLSLLTTLKDRFGWLIGMDEFLAAPTVAGIAAAIGSRQWGGAVRPSLVPLNRGAGPAMVMVPGAAGNPMAYRRVASAVPGHRMLGFALPAGRGAFDDVAAAGAALADRLRVEATSAGPVSLIGHSFGAAVAVEAARRLADAGCPPALLVLIDLPAPGTGPALADPGDDCMLLADIAEAAARYFDRPITVTAAALAALPPSRRLERFTTALEEAGVLPPGSDTGLAEAMAALYKSSLTALARWQPAPLVLPRVAVLWAEQSTAAGDGGADMGGWAALFPGCRLESRRVSGDHISLMTGDHADMLGRVLAALLAGGGPVVEAAP